MDRKLKVSWIILNAFISGIRHQKVSPTQGVLTRPQWHRRVRILHVFVLGVTSVFALMPSSVRGQCPSYQVSVVSPPTQVVASAGEHFYTLTVTISPPMNNYTSNLLQIGPQGSNGFAIYSGGYKSGSSSQSPVMEFFVADPSVYTQPVTITFNAALSGFCIFNGTSTPITSNTFQFPITVIPVPCTQAGASCAGMPPANCAAPTILDPVAIDPSHSSLLSGPAVTTNASLIPGNGRSVQGVAADGVTEVVVAVPANQVGDVCTLTVINDQNVPSSLPVQDGALGALGDSTFVSSQISGAAVQTSYGPFAFAVYRAPTDFARDLGVGGNNYMQGSCGGVTNTDDQLACRQVSIQAQDSGGNQSSLPVTILRAPVILIHGLWGDWTTWSTFSPLITGVLTVDPRFYIGRVNYGSQIGELINSSAPAYASYSKATGSALGFSYNAGVVLPQINQWIKNFKSGQNPANIPVAAVQADIVAHSMGGNIARALVLQPGFLSDLNFGQGNIHKIITIDTPHLGSPIATDLVLFGQIESCLQGLLAQKGDFAFSSVTLSGQLVNGAMADLGGLPVSNQPTALSQIAASGPHFLPTALIVGVYTEFWSLTTSPDAFGIRNWPFGCPNDPLAQTLTSSGWPANFSGQPNDAMVSEGSQLNGLNAAAGFVLTPSYVHSLSTEKLGFLSPSVLDSGVVPNQVIAFLNLPVTEAAFNPLNP